MIYFITQQDKYVKIGYTGNSPVKRFISLQIGNPHKLTLWGAIQGDATEEAYLHRMFRKNHLRGEWYHLTTDIIKYMYIVEPERLCDSEVELAYLKEQHGLLDRLRRKNEKETP